MDCGIEPRLGVIPFCSLIRDPFSYSYRSASIGLSAAARWAGYNPKNPPIAAAQPNDNTTDIIDTLVVHAKI